MKLADDVELFGCGEANDRIIYGLCVPSADQPSHLSNACLISSSTLGMSASLGITDRVCHGRTAGAKRLVVADG